MTLYEAIQDLITVWIDMWLGIIKRLTPKKSNFKEGGIVSAKAGSLTIPHVHDFAIPIDSDQMRIIESIKAGKKKDIYINPIKSRRILNDPK